MQRWLWLFALAFAVAACGSEGDESGGAGTDGFRELTAADLVHKSFRFGPDAGIFEADDPRKGQPATLIVGEVYERSHGAGFALTSDDGSIQGGTLTLGSCNFDTTFVQFAGQAPVVVTDPVFFYCGVDDDGRLGLLEDEETPPIISEPPTTPSADLDIMIPLSPLALIDPHFDPRTRPETGALSLRLFGNVLSYSMVVNDLSEGDELRDGQVRQGASSENGDLIFTLFGSPVQPHRQINPPFISGTRIAASIFLSPNEVAALTDASQAKHVQVMSLQELSGLMRGQVHEGSP